MENKCLSKHLIQEKILNAFSPRVTHMSDPNNLFWTQRSTRLYFLVKRPRVKPAIFGLHANPLTQRAQTLAWGPLPFHGHSTSGPLQDVGGYQQKESGLLFQEFGTSNKIEEMCCCSACVTLPREWCISAAVQLHSWTALEQTGRRYQHLVRYFWYLICWFISEFKYKKITQRNRFCTVKNGDVWLSFKRQILFFFKAEVCLWAKLPNLFEV